ncbi:MAG: helicase-associated domain-containing protein [Gordonia sp. (in: high G+C Gram-positive bacteria)]|uniref:helicase-associated domain-containing protein n=1 Tax=Gordonia sp. (in: high G+C Gram-positive bacteria) TaxID=84139 RepID=UPI0039E5E820
MNPDRPQRGLAETLADRSDEQLAQLLTARPDLASPPPRGSAVLAQRALSASSLALAGDALDLAGVAVLEAFLDAAAGTDRHDLIGPVTRDDVVSRLGRRLRRAEVDARLRALEAQCLIWDSGAGAPKRTDPKKTAWVGGIHLAAALPWRGHQLLGPLATVPPDEIRALLDDLDDRPRELLDTLAAGPALGRSRDAAPDADPAAPVSRLIAAGLLLRIDEQTVELPPMVGRLLRGEPPLTTATLGTPEPTAGPGRFGADDVDAAGAGEALELLRHAGDLVDVVGRTPATILKSGGLGIRELRRLAKATGLPVARVGLLTEVLAAARLLDAGLPDPEPADWSGDEAFAPTVAVDPWLHLGPERRWHALAAAWLELPRRPWQIGDTDRDGNTLAALSSELFDASAPLTRRQILAPLLDVPPAAPVETEALVDTLCWRHPRQLRRWTRRFVGETLREARELGLVAHGCLTGPGRMLLTASTEDDEGAAEVLAAMDRALPEPVDHFLVQADLTLMVPGPMTVELAEQVQAIADLESGGAASVYRISEDSLRRALDTGRSGSEIVTLLESRSRTPVPQSLTYLVEDVARRHGSLRVGVASSFVRCEDPALLAAVLTSEAAAEVSLRALASTVAVSAASLREVVDALRRHGFAPAGEDSTGALVDLRSRGSRVPARAASPRPRPRRARIAPGQVQTVVDRLRAADRADAPPTGSVRAAGGGESASALIQLALRTGRPVRLGYVDAHGAASRHVVRPRALHAGHLLGATDDEADVSFSLHRITHLEVL